MLESTGCTYHHLEHANDLEPSVGHAWLREHCPVHLEQQNDPPFFVVSRHDAALEILKQPDSWGNQDGPGIFVQQGGVLGSTDNPDHDRQRRVLRPVFLPTVIARMESRVAAVVDTMMDAFVPAGEGDFVEDYAFTMPALVIGELLGVDPADRNNFRDWSTAVVNALGGGDIGQYQAATDNIVSYIFRQVETRAEMLGRTELDPDDDPVGRELPVDAISVMYVAHLRGELRRSEIGRLGHQMLVAGHETTTGLLGLMMFRFCKQPELLEQLRADRSLLEVAVEEGLRFDSPVQGLFRTNPEPGLVGGTAIPPKTKLQVLFASANRDPDRWEDPDSFRLDRDLHDLRQHLAFGWAGTTASARRLPVSKPASPSTASLTGCSTSNSPASRCRRSRSSSVASRVFRSDGVPADSSGTTSSYVCILQSRADQGHSVDCPADDEYRRRHR